MRFYKLIFNDSNDKDIICFCEETYGIDQYELKEGKNFTKWNERVVFQFDPTAGDRPTDYMANHLGLSVVSQNLRSVIEQFEIKVEYFPITIMNRATGEYLGNYFVANFLNVIDALSLEHSIYKKFKLDSEEIISVQKYALYKEKILGANIIKLRGDVIPIFVSEAFKIEIENNRLSGCEFIEVKVI